MKAAISVVHKRENGAASFKLRNTDEAPGVQAEAMYPAPSLATHPNNRGQIVARTRIALGQFRCQRHRRFNRTRRFGGLTRYCHLLVFVVPATKALDPLQ